jgi:LysM repeat protein
MMNTYTIGGKRYRYKFRAGFVRFVTIVAIIATLIAAAAIVSGFAEGGGVSGTETRTFESVTIKSGDTLWSIARDRKPEGKSTRQFVYDIRKANDIDPGNIHPGQIIKAPVVE